jgi:NADH-quinone oxidoreductase subunit L
MFRMIFMTFTDEYRPGTVESPFAHHAHDDHGHDEHAHAEHGHAAHGHDDHGHHAPAHASAHGHDAHGHAAHAHAAPAHAAKAHDDHGAHGGHDEHAKPHESPLPMLVALCILAFCGVFGGHFWLADPVHSLKFWEHAHTWFEESVSFQSLYGAEIGDKLAAAIAVDHHAEHTAHWVALPVSLAVASLGILIAWLIYGRGWERSQRIAGKITHSIHAIYEVVKGKYYVDEALGTAIVVDMKRKEEPRYEPDVSVIGASMHFANLLSWIDRNVIDAMVNLVGRTGAAIGKGSAAFDRTVVDGAVTGVGLVTQTFGSVARLFQRSRAAVRDLRGLRRARARRLAHPPLVRSQTSYHPSCSPRS